METLLKLTCVVLEDEDHIRKWLVEKLETFSELELIGEAASIDKAFQLISILKPDVAFMDIKLIGGDAFTLLARLRDQAVQIPYIVITTGFPEYVMTALNDYRQYIVQYLVKPFVSGWQEKLRKSIDALISAKLNGANHQDHTDHPNSTPHQEFTFISSKKNLVKIDFHTLAYLEAAGGGETYFVTDSGDHLIDKTITKCLAEILPSYFIRISKSNAVNKNRIISICREDRTLEVEVAGTQKHLGLGEAYYHEVIKELK